MNDFNTTYLNPHDKLKSLPDIELYLKDLITIEKMDRQAYDISDNQSADQLNKARQLLIKSIDEPLFNQL